MAKILLHILNVLTVKYWEAKEFKVCLSCPCSSRGGSGRTGMWFVVWHYPFVNIDYEHDSQWPLLYAISQTSCASWCIHVERTKDIPEPHCWLRATFGRWRTENCPEWNAEVCQGWVTSAICFQWTLHAASRCSGKCFPLYAIITSLDFYSNFGWVWSQKRGKNCVWKEAEQGQLAANTCI